MFAPLQGETDRQTECLMERRLAEEDLRELLLRPPPEEQPQEAQGWIYGQPGGAGRGSQSSLANSHRVFAFRRFFSSTTSGRDSE